jgi:hypothetical protein
MIHQQAQAGSQGKKEREKTYISENLIQAKHFINREIFTTSAKAP